MNTERSKKVSKFLSLVLRHQPEAAGVTLDAAGWTDVKDLLEGATAAGVDISRGEMEEIVATSDKQRFALSDDGTRIRANQGHSVQVELGYEPAEPPDVLFHGTIARALSSIKADGLRPMKRHHVHLSADVETARIVGSRRGKPVVLRVDARAMAAEGRTFYRSANGVWLTEEVPGRFLDHHEPEHD